MKPEDYDIEIPGVVRDNIAKEIQVKVADRLPKNVVVFRYGAIWAAWRPSDLSGGRSCSTDQRPMRSTSSPFAGAHAVIGRPSGAQDDLLEPAG